MSCLHTELAFNRDAEHPLHRLPFIKLGHKSGMNFWAVPATGGYHGGYEVGVVMGQAYLKYQRANEGLPTVISGIVDAITRRMIAAGLVEHFEISTMLWPDELASLRGQKAGFLNTLNWQAGNASRSLGSYLDQISEAEIISKANVALLKVDTHKADLLKRKPRAKQATHRHQ